MLQEFIALILKENLQSIDLIAEVKKLELFNTLMKVDMLKLMQLLKCNLHGEVLVKDEP
jgi:hypothetical protein